ncbi:MAG: 2OG-Fe(II) oxygenase [Gammaproteobacteria bacterium]
MTTALDLGCHSSAAEDDLFEAIASGLEQQGYVVLPAALPETIAASLLDYLAVLEANRFHRAAVGRGNDQQRNQFVRRDRIHWIEDDHQESGQWLAWSKRLQQYLNRRLFLGLFSFESHFSFYEAGDFYRKHLDAFRGESNRVLSLVTYLNKGWEPDQGGELVIYTPDGAEEMLHVQPGYATLVLFLSSEFPHEVKPTSRDRFAVAGWFRVNNSINDNIDPPR